MRIELRDVVKQFGAFRALDGITLEIASGSKVAIIGPNGSGKSTLLRALMGIVGCDGQVLLGGKSPFAERELLAQQLAYVPQVPPTFGAPVGELVQAICQVRAIPVQRVACLTASLELSLDAVHARPFRGLSGGMKQKLLIALALAAEAPLMILDEPTASLDARARERFFRLVETHERGSTLLLCSHRLEEIRHMVSEVVALQDGRVAFHGPASRFLDERALSMVEVCIDAETHAPWLRERGFQLGGSGWWHRTVTQGEKLELLGRLTEGLGTALQNLVVRDLEAVEATPSGESHG